MNRASERRIPSLDGMRAISIVLVLLSHLAGTRNFPLSVETGNFWSLGHLGVHVFFVISGYLITGLLLDELTGTGKIRLPRFYFRRTLRIFPAYYVLIGALVVAASMGMVTLAPHDVLHTVSYTSNYYGDRSWYLGHTWSLSVEEQFYLLWPAVLMLSGPRRAFVIAAAVVAVCPFIRVAEWELVRSAGNGIGARFETVADAIAIGCLLAGARPWLHRSPLYRKILASPFFVVVPLLAVAGNLTHDHPLVSFALGMTLANVAVAFCLDWCVTFPEGRVGRVLNAAPLVFVGWISYSLYLWQQPFLNRSSTSAFAAFPLNILLTIALALASYFLVERPTLQFRKWLEQRQRRRVAVPVGPDPRPGIAMPSGNAS